MEAQRYAVGINKVLLSDVSDRKGAFEEMLATLQPPKNVLTTMSVSKFLDGTFAVDRSKSTVFILTKNKPGTLTCTICGTEHKFQKQSRALRHLTCKAHHDVLKKKADAAARQRSQEMMNEQTATFASNLIDNIHNKFIDNS